METLPVAERTAFSPKGDASVPLALPVDPKSQPSYRRLGAHECLCLAVEASSVGNLLAAEARSVLQQAEGRKLCAEKSRHTASVNAQILTYLAEEDRNRSAAKALDLFFRLGQAEAETDILRVTLTHVGDALSKARDLKSKGLEVPVSDTTLHRQQLDLQARAVKLRIQIEELNSELRRLLDFEPVKGEWRFLPFDAFHLEGHAVDPDEAVATALANKPELLLLSLLESESTSGDLKALRQQLRMLNSVLGQSPMAKCPKLQQLLAALCGSSGDELAIRQQQLREYHAQRRREVAEEVRQAARTVLTQPAVVVLTQQRAASWRERVQEMEEKEAKGVSSFAETTDARVEWLKVRRNVVEEIIGLQRARVRLRQAQGILPRQCQPSPSNCCPSR
ncbi:MAG TPA: TolC family protein [Gemmataceae bacterium]